MQHSSVTKVTVALASWPANQRLSLRAAANALSCSRRPTSVRLEGGQNNRNTLELWGGQHRSKVTRDASENRWAQRKTSYCYRWKSDLYRDHATEASPVQRLSV